MPKTFAEINQRIREGKAVVVTAEEVIPLVREKGPRRVAQEVDVVTTATFAPMCSSGAFLNFGHSEPPIKMQSVRLNDVPAHAGVAAVDAYLGATELSRVRGMDYGGAHVIEDLVSRRPVLLEAESYGTDCYPRRSIRTFISLDSLNQAYLFNPRNCYQNYAAATNGSDRIIYTYMGKLLPRFGNVTYCSAGQLSPLLNDPDLRTVGIGTRVFLGGGIGYVAWEGTQHFPARRRRGDTPVGPAATLALVGDLRGMDPRFLRAATFTGYGVTLFVGVGIAIPILDEDLARQVAVSDREIHTVVLDYGQPHRDRPVVAEVSYAELRSGRVLLRDRWVPAAPLSSLRKAREIAVILKDWVASGRFLLTEPVAPLPWRDSLHTLAVTPRAGSDPAAAETAASAEGDGRGASGRAGVPAAPEVAAPAQGAEGKGVEVPPSPATDLLRNGRGRPEPDGERCVACGACTGVCLPGALHLDPATWELCWRPDLCTSCALCLDACPVGALGVAVPAGGEG
ncbi:MAG: homocysteine biosynthesis protein [Bacillota bacterium]